MKEYKKLIPKEKNTQKHDIFHLYRSNSQNHIKDISNYNYEHRIKLNPMGEQKTMDIRNQIPIGHIPDLYIKIDYIHCRNKNRTANENADIQSKIQKHIKNQKHQELLEKDKTINKICKDKNNEIKKIFINKKTKLKEELTRIIKDTLIFSQKNNPVRAMLPDNINEIVEKAKKEAQNASLNMSNISKISKVSSVGVRSSIQKNEFLNLLGVDLENLNAHNINIDIDKCWNFVMKLAKGRKIEDILRYKVVNEIMNITEKKSAEKAKKIYEKLEIYKKYMKGKKSEEKMRKKREEEKMKKFIRTNSQEYIKIKMKKSLSQPKLFNQNLELENIKKKKKDSNKRNIKKGRRKMKRAESEILSENKKTVLRLDSYNDVDKIINFIDSSKRNSQSKVCRKHFSNIQMTKNVTNIPIIFEKNKIIYK